MGPGSLGGKDPAGGGDVRPAASDAASALAAVGGSGSVLFVDNEVQRRVIDMRLAIDVMAAAYREWADGGATPLPSDVVAGRAPGRTRGRQVTIFCNNEGTRLRFAAVGRVILDAVRAEAGHSGSDGGPRGRGLKTVPLQWLLQDIPD